MIVDHIDPMVPIETHFEDMMLDESVNRLWCELTNLQAVCETCHDVKTAQEKQARKPYAKPRKKKACAKT